MRAQRRRAQGKHYSHDGDVLSIPYSYWAGIVRELQETGYVRGFIIVETWGGGLIVRASKPSITVQSVEFLQRERPHAEGP